MNRPGLLFRSAQGEILCSPNIPIDYKQLS